MPVGQSTAQPSFVLVASVLLQAVLLSSINLDGRLADRKAHAAPSDETVRSATMGEGAENGYRTVAYFVNWAIYGRKHRPQDLPVEKLSHVLYAFANVRPESGEVHLTDPWADTDIHWEGDSWNEPGTILYGCLKQLNLLKRRRRQLKVLLSVGGWSYSGNFAAPASTASARARFAESCVGLIRDLGFDGIDVDWEYPQDAGQAADLVSLLRAVRQAMDAYTDSLPDRYRFELTVACPAGAEQYEQLDVAAMDGLVDSWNLMAYDYAGSWHPLAGHQANLYACAGDGGQCTPFSTEAALRHYIGRGVAAGKIVLGMPLYGRAFEHTDGPGQPYSGVGEGGWEAGVHDYKRLPPAGAEEREDDEAGASYCYDAGRRTMVSYDTVVGARRKADFIRQRGLGGAMWWESSGDKDGPDSLISTVVEALGGPAALDTRLNCVQQPGSRYDNLRTGFPADT